MRLRFLFVAVCSPLPVNNGQRMRIWSLLRALAAEGHETDLLAVADAAEFEKHKAEMLGMCRIAEVVPASLPNWSQGSAGYASRLRGLLSPAPYGTGRFRSADMIARIRAAAGSGRYDAILAATPYSLINIPADVTVPILVDDQNIEHMLLRRYLENERNPARWAYAWLEWRKFRRWEGRSCARGAVTAVCSEVDRATMRQMCPATPVTVIPNIIDVETYRVAPSGEDGRLLYVGGLDWLPNRDAVQFFVERILPELRKEQPRIRLAIFSPDHAPPADFRSRLESIPEVELVKTTDVRGEIARASVLVVPIRIGSGTRFKILEAAATGKAVVSTRVGAEGLTFANGAEILLEDEPAAFARAVLGLLADAPRRAAMGAAARQRVEQEYSFAALRAKLRETLATFQSVVEGCRYPARSTH